MSEITTEAGKALLNMRRTPGLGSEVYKRTIIAIEQEAFWRGRDYGFDTAQSFHQEARKDRPQLAALLLRWRRYEHGGTLEIETDRALQALAKDGDSPIPASRADSLDAPRHFKELPNSQANIDRETGKRLTYE